MALPQVTQEQGGCTAMKSCAHPRPAMQCMLPPCLSRCRARPSAPARQRMSNQILFYTPTAGPHAAPLRTKICTSDNLMPLWERAGLHTVALSESLIA